LEFQKLLTLQMEARIRSEIAVHFYHTLRIYNPKVCNIRTFAQILVPLTPSILSLVFFFYHFLFLFLHVSLTS